jgi:hypothetical protein
MVWFKKNNPSRGEGKGIKIPHGLWVKCIQKGSGEEF